MKVILSKQQRRPALSDRRLLLRALHEATELCRLDDIFKRGADAELHIIIVDAERMAEMNQAFLGHSGPTDVLAFELADETPMPSEDEPDIVGEIYLCLDVAMSASTDYDTSLGQEVVLYAVHGMLHLSGLDDADDAARKHMREEERRVLDALQAKFDLRAIFAGFGDTPPSDSEG